MCIAEESLNQIYLQKNENALREKEGLSALPEEDVTKMFKAPPAVGRLEPLLSCNRVSFELRSPAKNCAICQ